MRFSRDQEPGAKKLKSQIKDFTTFERFFKVQQWLREGGGEGVEEGGRGGKRRGWKEGKGRREEEIMM